MSKTKGFLLAAGIVSAMAFTISSLSGEDNDLIPSNTQQGVKNEI